MVQHDMLDAQSVTGTRRTREKGEKRGCSRAADSNMSYPNQYRTQMLTWPFLGQTLDPLPAPKNYHLRHFCRHGHH
jgi:hypothetical protein